MPIDYALILSAGMGTRMGEIGKLLPKVLWPIFTKSLLELQVRYCQEMGIEKIYINTHFLHKEIENFVRQSSFSRDVVLLHENPLLDSGGAIHNLAIRPEINYKGNLLMVNGDQFLFFNDTKWKEGIEAIEGARASLFTIKVEASSHYNETVASNKKLIEIKKNIQKDRDYFTYSGLGILKLDGLKPVPGISRFFETVVNYNKEVVELIHLDKFEYWDFGTAEIYFNNILKLKTPENLSCLMNLFLNKWSGEDEVHTNFLNSSMRSINLDNQGNFSPNSMVYKNILQPV